jgi:hypothetical protein
MGPPGPAEKKARVWVARAFTLVEDVVYIGLGLLLAGSAFTLLITGVVQFVRSASVGEARTIDLLERILLILLVVELLYTVQVSFREHALVPEPFLLVGLISAIRRVLVLTAEFGELREQTPGGRKLPVIDPQHFVIELGVLTVLIIALAISLVLLRRSGAAVVARRDTMDGPAGLDVDATGANAVSRSP